MTHYIKRCKHCGLEYLYQGSGEGCFEPTNDEDFCPECKAAIIEALSKIPKKFGKSSVEVEVSPGTIFHMVEKVESERDPNALFGRQIYAGLYNMNAGEHQTVRDVKWSKINGVEPKYIYSYWPSKPEEMNVHLEVEKDLKTGEAIGIWGAYGNQSRRRLDLPTLPEVPSDVQEQLVEKHRVPLKEPNKNRNVYTPEMIEDIKNFKSIDVEAELEDLLSRKVPPMKLPTGNLHYLDFKYDDKKNDKKDGLE